MSAHLTRIQNIVVVVSGEQGRKDFCNAKGLDIQEGYEILSGGVRISDYSSWLPPIRVTLRPRSLSYMA